MADIRYGKTGTWNITVGVKQDMDEAIQILSPTDVPLQQWAGSSPTSSTKVEWLEEELMSQSITIVGAPTGTGPWTITFAAGEGDPLRPGDVLYKNDAASAVQYVVNSVDTAANTAEVAGFAGNTVAPANTEVLTIVGQYRTEGGDPEEARSRGRDTKFNYTQIGEERVEATRTSRKLAVFAQVDPYDHEVEKKFKELAIRFEKSFVHGQRAIAGANDKRFMGGLFYYITTNTVSGVKANSGSLINDLLRKVYDAGGTADTLMVSPSVKRAISESVDAAARRTTRTESTGGFVIDRYMSDFGEINIVINRHFPKTKGLALQREFIVQRPFDAYFHELLAKTGDSDKGHIVGEYSLEVKNEKAHGVLTLTDA